MTNLLGIITIICIVMFAMIGMSTSQTSDLALLQDANTEYCEMVELWNNSNGDLGWPDYKNTYNRDCN